MLKTMSIASLGVRVAAAGVLLAMATGCSSSPDKPGQSPSEVPSSTGPSSTQPASSSATPMVTSTASAAPPPPAPVAPVAPPPSSPTVAEQHLAALSLEQRVGQLFMVAAKATGPDPATFDALKRYHVGNVYLSGRSTAGAAAAASVVSSLTGTVGTDTTGGLPLFVATDQEGGLVQVLSGPGFSTMPPALGQAGAGPAKLRSNAAVWGKELLGVGVNVNLAPVLDTVTSPDFAPSNAAIGHFQREYGFDPKQVSGLGNAFAQGMKDAGVMPVVKHYPGLGRVVPNTDVSSNVHDSVTSRTDPDLAPFNAAITSGAQWVMLSNAYYDRIDPANIAPFSPDIIQTMLRGDAGFTGIVLSDDLCSAGQLRPWAVADRALKFFGAGGTMLVCAEPSSIPVMQQAVVQRAQADPAFRAKVDAAALTVLRVKSGK